jgi:uncharacterized protein YdeI (BOF family)
MFMFNRVWIALIIFTSLVAVPIRTFAQTPTVIFSEIAWAGSSYSSSDEWLELSNLTNESVDISGWILTGVGSSENDLVVPDGSTIEPYSTFLITNYDASHENSALSVESNYATATLSLPNNGFSASVFDNDGSLVDVAGADGAAFAGRSGSTANTDDGRYRSMVRISGELNGSDETAWADAQESTGFKNGVEDVGTPGTLETWIVQTETVDPEETTETEPATAYLPGTMLINEFVVDPLEEEFEWIEFINMSSEVVDTTGWTIEDATERTTELDALILEPGDHLVVEAPKGKLNNDTDVIMLRDGTGTVIDSVAYGTDDLPAPKDGDALARGPDGEFALTQTVTPGGPNVINIEVEVETEATEVDASETEEENLDDDIQVDNVEEHSTEEVSNESVEVDEATNESNESENLVEESIEEEELIETAYTGPTTLQFISLYPNTVGADAEEEYIELENTGSQTIDLKGWIIEDGSTDQYTFSNTINLASGTTLRLVRPVTSLSLNNTGDTLELISPTGSVIDLVSYGNAPRGGTYDRDGSLWSWSTTVEEVVEVEVVSQNEPTSQPAPTLVSTDQPTNTSAQPAQTASTSSTKTASTSSSTTASSTSTASYVSFFSIEQAKAQKDGMKVRIEGYVTAVPDTFGRQIMYAQDQSGGIQVYFYDASYPNIEIGTEVRIEGTMSTAYGERRVKISETHDISPTGNQTQTNPMHFSIADLSDPHLGSLIETSGQILSRSATKLVIENREDRITIYLKSNPEIDANQFERGDKITTAGILTTYSGELRVRPRTEEDITINETASAVLAATTDSGKTILGDTKSRAGMTVVLVVLTLLATAAVIRKFPQRREALGT